MAKNNMPVGLTREDYLPASNAWASPEDKGKANANSGKTRRKRQNREKNARAAATAEKK